MNMIRVMLVTLALTLVACGDDATGRDELMPLSDVLGWWIADGVRETIYTTEEELVLGFFLDPTVEFPEFYADVPKGRTEYWYLYALFDEDTGDTVFSTSCGTQSWRLAEQTEITITLCSPDEYCLTFDRGAEGTLRMLKPLDQTTYLKRTSAPVCD